MRNISHVKQVFEQHKDRHTNLISISALPGALIDLGISLTTEEISVLFETSDTDENGGLDEQEFTKAVKYPGKVEQWADSLPLSKLLAHCLSFRFKEGDDPLREVSRLSSAELRASANAFGESVETILGDAVGELKKCYAEMDRMAAESASSASSKFQTFKMSSGSVEDFHSGLQGRVGAFALATDSSKLLFANPFMSPLQTHLRCRRSTPQSVQGHGGGALRQGGLRRRVHLQQLRRADDPSQGV
jgi:hypothetical protein